jgi:hypothetical protein
LHPFVRGQATKDKLKPAKRKGCLDADRLRAHGLTGERMKNDPFFLMNIIGVNNLPSASLYATVKSRGKKPNKKYWGIEQNEERAVYLGHYYGVDNVNHMIKNAKICYTTWKY